MVLRLCVVVQHPQKKIVAIEILILPGRRTLDLQIPKHQDMNIRDIPTTATMSSGVQ